MGDGRGSQHLKVVAALEGRDDAPPWRVPCQHFGEPGEIAVLEQLIAQRVASVGVESTADKHEARREFACQPGDVRLEDLVLAIDGKARRQRAIERESPAGAAARLDFATGAGVVRVLVQRVVRHRGIVIEDLLGSVPVVDVPVDDEHPLAAEALEVPRRDRHGVEQAESHRPVARRVVTGRAHEAEGRRDPAFSPGGSAREQLSGRGHHRSGGQAGRSRAPRREHRIRVEAAVSAVRGVDAPQMLGGVTPENGCVVGGSAPAPLEAPIELRRRSQRRLDRGESSGALPVRSGIVLEKERVSVDGYRHRFVTPG